MDPAAICPHCQVEMTSWSAPGSPIRYYQCPFCARTHASCYREAFARGAGARLAAATAPLAASPASPAVAREEAARWATVRARAARWFARLEAEEQRATSEPRHPQPPQARSLAPHAGPPHAGPRPTPSPPAVAARPARHR